LYLDAGVEVRRNLEGVVHILQQRGVFSIQQSNVVGARTHAYMRSALGANDLELFNELPFCTAGLTGFNTRRSVLVCLVDFYG
jgi:hypothetical protein